MRDLRRHHALRFFLIAGVIALCFVAGCAPTAERAQRGQGSGTKAAIAHFERAAPRPQGYPHGAQVVKLDEDGNAIDAKADYIAYFGGTYYLYGESYDCVYQFFPTPNFCGFRAYSSKDLVRWKSLGRFIDPATSEFARETCKTTVGCWGPLVVYNPPTRKYILWFYRAIGKPTTTPLVVMRSDSPTGPWVEPTLPNVPTGFAQDVFINEDGSAYLAWGSPSSGIHVQKLNSSYTDVEGPPTVVTQPLGKVSDPQCQPPGGMTGTDFQNQTPKLMAAWKECALTESPSLFRKGDQYYLTFSDPICAFCLGTGTSYFVARSPLGPWLGRGDSPSFDAANPRKFDAYSISADSCGGQPFHVATLPTADGKGVHLYTAVLWENSRNEGSANHYWEPLRFGADGLMLPLTCTDTSIPLAKSADSARLDVNKAQPRAINLAAVAAGGTVTQTMTAPSDGTIQSLQLSLYQKTNPTRSFADEGRVSAPLTLELSTSRGRVERVFAPEAVSWSPTRVRIDADLVVRRGDVITLRLSSPTPAGLYATLFADHDRYPQGRAGGTGLAATLLNERSDLLFSATQQTAAGVVSFGSLGE